MSDQNDKVLPIRFDPQVFAGRDQELAGVVAIKAMKRLQNLVLTAEPMVTARLKFSRGQYGLPAVTGQIKHTLGLRCERCLDEVQISIDQPLEVLLKPDSESVSGNTENIEFYEYDGKSLELAELIEDELLLSLPLVPRHKDISLCNQDMIAWLASNEVPADQAENPFAILKR